MGTVALSAKRGRAGDSKLVGPRDTEICWPLASWT